MTEPTHQTINRFIIANRLDETTAKPLPNRRDRRALARQMARDLNRTRKASQ
jgi:hypothetical protein